MTDSELESVLRMVISVKGIEKTINELTEDMEKEIAGDMSPARMFKLLKVIREKNALNTGVLCMLFEDLTKRSVKEWNEENARKREQESSARAGDKE